MSDLDELMMWCRLIPLPELEKLLGVELENVSPSPVEQPSEHKGLFDDDRPED